MSASAPLASLEADANTMIPVSIFVSTYHVDINSSRVGKTTHLIIIIIIIIICQLKMVAWG